MPHTTHRRTYRLHRTGALSNLKLETENLESALAPNELLVEVRAIGLNFADIFAIFGLYSATPKTPFIPGLEYAGTVTATGSQVTNLRVGGRVMGAIRFGAYTTHISTDAAYVLPLPDDWSFAEGAAFIVQALTAYYALKHLGGLEDILRRQAEAQAETQTEAQTETQTAEPASILIHSAAGGVGIYANRIAKAMAAAAGTSIRTIGTVGSASKLDLLQREGYDRVIVRSGDNSNRAAQDFKRLLGDALLHKSSQPSPLPLILDSLGGRVMRAGYDALAPAGRVVCFGSAHLAFQGNRPNYLRLAWNYLQRPRFDPLEMIETNKAVLGFNLIYLWDNLPLMHEMFRELAAMQLPKPLVGHTFPFEQLPEALVKFQSGTTTGKVVVTVE
jgi:NADPH:quinone reductase-like Zn-dependent oxidoreductase